MPDVTSIGAMLGSIKSAIAIVKYLNESGSSLEKAELKLKLAELTGALADAKIEMLSVQEALAEKDRRIEELNEAFEMRLSLFRHGDAYYRQDETGKRIGVAYCLRCWENDHKARQLVDTGGGMGLRNCTTCGQKYTGRNAWDQR